jgi:hypothetical protein
MTLIVVTIVAIASVTTALAIPLFMIGTVLGRTAGNLSDSVQSVRSIAGQAPAMSDPTTSSPTTGSSVGRLDVVPATGLGYLDV